MDETHSVSCLGPSVPDQPTAVRLSQCDRGCSRKKFDDGGDDEALDMQLGWIVVARQSQAFGSAMSPLVTRFALSSVEWRN